MLEQWDKDVKVDSGLNYSTLSYYDLMCVVHALDFSNMPEEVFIIVESNELIPYVKRFLRHSLGTPSQVASFHEWYYRGLGTRFFVYSPEEEKKYYDQVYNKGATAFRVDQGTSCVTEDALQWITSCKVEEEYAKRMIVSMIKEGTTPDLV